jgi:hypothetical protein
MCAPSILLRPAQAREDIEAEGVMLWIGFSTSDIHDAVMLPSGGRLNHDFFRGEGLDHFDDGTAETRKTK